MDKIIMIALEARGFTPEQVISIIEVASATGNKTIAVEKLLGIYSTPKLAPQSKLTYTDDMVEFVAKFISFDPFKDEVHYTCDIELKRFYTTKEKATKGGDWDVRRKLVDDYKYEGIMKKTLQRSTSTKNWIENNVRY